jgi:hypothetical protein
MHRHCSIMMGNKGFGRAALLNLSAVSIALDLKLAASLLSYHTVALGDPPWKAGVDSTKGKLILN